MRDYDIETHASAAAIIQITLKRFMTTDSAKRQKRKLIKMIPGLESFFELFFVKKIYIIEIRW